MKGLLLLLGLVLGVCALPQPLDGWAVWELPKSVKEVPGACREWERRRDGIVLVACPSHATVAGRMVIADVGARMRAEREPNRLLPRAIDPFFSMFRTLDEIAAQVALYQRNFPSLVSTSVLGTTAEGRNITLVRVAKSTGLPIVFFSSGLHAREWIGPMSLMYHLDAILSAMSSSPSATAGRYEWHLVMNANPDGFVHSWTTDRMWRKNRWPNNGSGCVGTDNNRNFAWRWGESGSSTNRCSDVYQGSVAGSEAETIALQQHMRSISGRCICFCDVHSYASSWMSVFGYKAGVYPSNYAALLRAMQATQRAAAAVNGLTYRIGTDADVLSEASGGSDDFAFSVGINASFTVELRGDSFVATTADIPLSGSEFSVGAIALVETLRLEILSGGAASNMVPIMAITLGIVLVFITF